MVKLVGLGAERFKVVSKLLRPSYWRVVVNLKQSNLGVVLSSSWISISAFDQS